MLSISLQAQLTNRTVLGLNSQNGARRLARALLADPLALEPAWEKQLTETEISDGKALLLRCIWVQKLRDDTEKYV